MVATLVVNLDTEGVDGTPSEIHAVSALGPPNLRFKSADAGSDVIDTNDKIVIAAAGLKYSRWKSIYLICTNADGHTMNNVAIYGDAANAWTPDVDVMVGDEFPNRHYTGAAPNYSGYEEADTADQEMVADHGGITGSASLWTYTDVAPLAVTINVAVQGSVIDAANETSCYVILQMNVDDTAVPGDLANETGSFSYDEA